MSAEGAEATGGEGVTLTEAERKTLNRAQFLTPPTLEDNPVHAAVEGIVAARVQQAEAKRDAARREERMRAEDHARAWQRVAEVEAERDALRERVEALTDLPTPGPAILCANPGDRDDQWRKVIRAALDGPR